MKGRKSRRLFTGLFLLLLLTISDGKSSYAQNWWESLTEDEWDVEQWGEEIRETEETTETNDEGEMESELSGDSKMQETEDGEHIIVVHQIQPSYENGYKEFDGSNEVLLSYEVENLPPECELSVIGYTDSASPGTYPVQIEAELTGETGDMYEICLDSEEMLLMIGPKPLRLTISSGSRPYYQENTIDHICFEKEEWITAEGFVTDETGNPWIPEGFALPQLTIDETVLERESPMYRNGKVRIYRDAITLKRKKDGTLTGNPTEYYCFLPEEEEYCKKGDIYLTEAFIEEGIDYELVTERGNSAISFGEIWAAPGSILSVVPKAGSGYSIGASFGPLQEGGVAEFSLAETDKKGVLSAVSQIRSLSWNVDGQAPSGEIRINGKQAGEQMICSAQELLLEVVVQDVGCGLKQVETYLAYGEECGYDPEELYGKSGKKWRSDTVLTLYQEEKQVLFVRAEDLVGNVTWFCSPVIIIDRTPPDIQIDNIRTGSAYQGTVIPLLQAKDENLIPESISFTISGYQSKERSITFQREYQEGVERIQMEDFPREKNWDDVYQLQVTARDLAGNETVKNLIFSVNRFGSTYYIEETLQEQLESYYLNAPPEIRLQEVNVDELVTAEIRIGYEGEVCTLQSGRDYEILSAGDRNGPRIYTYRIPSEQFSRDGHYYVSISSEDRAQNYNDNQSSQTGIEFAVDTQKPLISVTGIKDGEEYEEEPILQINCIDNMELDKIHVLVDGKEAGDERSLHQEIRLEEKDGWQNIRIYAIDRAGNRSDVTELTVWIGAKVRETQAEESETEAAEKTKKEKKTEGKTEDTMPSGKENARKDTRKGIGIFIVFSLFLKGILYFLKRAKQ